MLFTREQTAIQKVVHGNRNKDEAKGTFKREIFSQTRQILLNMARESENNIPVACHHFSSTTHVLTLYG